MEKQKDKNNVPMRVNVPIELKEYFEKLAEREQRSLSKQVTLILIRERDRLAESLAA